MIPGPLDDPRADIVVRSSDYTDFYAFIFLLSLSSTRDPHQTHVRARRHGKNTQVLSSCTLGVGTIEEVPLVLPATP
jgi:hypothetical protein